MPSCTQQSLAICILMLVCNPAWAVIVASGNGNTDAASLLAAAGPGDLALPGFANVGIRGSGGGSVVYLANRWVLTAAHLSLGSTVNFGGTNYTVDPGTITIVTNTDGRPTDLQLFQITSDPGLPEISPEYLASAPPSGRQIMIGAGQNTGDRKYWHLDTTQSPWVWETQTEAPEDPGYYDYCGFELTGGSTIRWGENNVLNTGVIVDNQTTKIVEYTTKFDYHPYTNVNPLAHEGQGTYGDSGGAVFTKVGDEWLLAGIMVSVGGLISVPPGSNAVYGMRTNIVQLSAYRDQILQIVPEPGTYALAAMAVAALMLVCWRHLRAAA